MTEVTHPALRDALGSDGAELSWCIGETRGQGAAVLDFAQGGVTLALGDSEVLVPPEVWSAWVMSLACRAVTLWTAGPGSPGIPGWLEGCLTFMGTTSPAEATRESVLFFAATANSMRALDSNDHALKALDTLVYAAWGWTYRRAFDDRRCSAAPHTLAADAVAVHRMLAERAGREVNAAAALEHDALYSDLLTLWRRYLEPPAEE